MASIFTRIINGEIPAHKVAESDRFLAFLDIRPLRKGHTLVIPKTEIDYIFDLDDDLLADIMVFAKRVAKAIKAVVPCNRIGVSVIGLEVPHAHVHLIPINAIGDMNFANTPWNSVRRKWPRSRRRFAVSLFKAGRIFLDITIPTIIAFRPSAKLIALVEMANGGRKGIGAIQIVLVEGDVHGIIEHRGNLLF